MAPKIARTMNAQVIGIGESRNIPKQKNTPFPILGYKTPPGPGPNTHKYIKPFEGQIRRGQTLVRALLELKQKFTPDIICGHHGWGETMFLKEVFPDAKQLTFLEFYYNSKGADVDFDPEFPNEFDDQFRIRVKNAPILLSLDAMDWGVSPTEWQRSQFPKPFRPFIDTIHDGIETQRLVPNPDATLTFSSDGQQKTVSRQEDEIITFVNRNLEPYRGFHVFMRALPEILRRRPNARVLIVGGDDVSYGKRPENGTYREIMMAEVGDKIDLSRVHFIGKLAYEDFITMLQVSSCHVYLTYPFVLSWSFLEAMSAECRIVASATQPVTEVMKDGETGLLVDFFDPAALAEAVDRTLSDPEAARVRAKAARELVVKRYDLHSVCLDQHVALISDVVNGTKAKGR